MNDAGEALTGGGHRVRTPKLVRTKVNSPGSKYYAGYGPEFVEDVVRALGLAESQTVLDPWNGAGTTTSVAARMRMGAIGVDVNPVLVIVGKSKLLGRDVVESLEPLTAEILAQARRLDDSTLPSDPLMQWFAPSTAQYLRRMERSIARLLVSSTKLMEFTQAESLDRVSALAASFYVVLFETARSFLGSYTTTNPTWFKVEKARGRLTVENDLLDARFVTLGRRRRLAIEGLPARCETEASAEIRLGSSTDLNIEASSIDACITSPPYCTRIDYAVLTRPELAVLGVGDDRAMKELRDNTIGTSTMVPGTSSPDERWGEYVSDLLGRIGTHTSKASGTYYLKYYVQYFDGIYRSMSELCRTLKPGAACAMVVQDSYYKDVHVDLARSVIEMGASLGWSTSERLDFPVSQVKASMNPRARRWRTSVVATESLVLLSRGKG